MRTIRKKVSVATRKALGLNDRPYEVSGMIGFVINPKLVGSGFILDLLDLLKPLREAILQVDAEFPWRDPGGADSICRLTEGEIIEPVVLETETICWFQFWPGVQKVSPGKVRAYEMYLANLARELAKRKLPNVCLVRGKMETFRAFEFSA